MVFMGMGQEDAANFVLVFFEVGEVGDDDIDAEHLFVGEAKAAVDDNDVVSLPNNGAVFADFSDTAERNHLNKGHLHLGYRVPKVKDRVTINL